ncbi:MAG: hypothetical protein ABIP54_01265 [Candidatus Andersenbacteria bacterium]
MSKQAVIGSGIKIMNIVGKIDAGTINLQTAIDVKYFYGIIRKYFEQELLSTPEQLDDVHLQYVLNRSVNEIELFNEFEFDNDVRIIELAVLIGILETLSAVGQLSPEYVFLPAWQLPRQEKIMKNFSGKNSWDGFLVGISRNSSKDALPIPIELKSLMTYPKKPVEGSPNHQLKALLNNPNFRKHFQKSGTINAVLVMPYTSEDLLSIDLKDAFDDLRGAISSETVGIVCMLSFPTNKNGKIIISILFALMFADPKTMSVVNKEQWMREITFGESKY